MRRANVNFGFTFQRRSPRGRRARSRLVSALAGGTIVGAMDPFRSPCWCPERHRLAGRTAESTIIGPFGHRDGRLCRSGYKGRLNAVVNARLIRAEAT
jgi:hypothetical protein